VLEAHVVTLAISEVLTEPAVCVHLGVGRPADQSAIEWIIHNTGVAAAGLSANQVVYDLTKSHTAKVCELPKHMSSKFLDPWFSLQT
jgi:hypothetical protein